MNGLNVFRNSLPRHALATNDLSRGLRMYAAFQAIQAAFVQFNARHSLKWLVFDIDRPTAAYDWDDRRCPPPNITAINPENGHAHLFYGLEIPVHDYDGASWKSLRYIASVDCALTEKLGADPGYSKLISKNPLHDRWIILLPRERLYDLEELASWLDMEKYRDRRRRLPKTGLGRNCTLFDVLRGWAYRERRQPYLSEEFFHEAVLRQALGINAEFNPPLPHSEVRATAKSVARWTWRRMSSDGFRALQKHRSILGNAEIKRRVNDMRMKVLESMKQCPTLTQEDIAALHGISRSTVCRYLRENVSNPISDKEGTNSHSSALPPFFQDGENDYKVLLSNTNNGKME